MKLRIEDLHLSFFGHTECLHAISMELQEGIHAVYGGVGAGKTALLKCIAGINEYTGSITLDGEPLVANKQAQNVGMVFDDLALFGRRSAYYNLTYPLRIRKIPRAEWEQRLAAPLEAWGLQRLFLDTQVFRLPKETQVRLALARASLFEKPVLLLDNPLGGLNPDSRRVLFHLLHRHMRTHKGIVMYATDDASELLALGAPVAVLSSGYLVGNGELVALQENPPCLLVAQRLNAHYSALEIKVEEGKALLGDWSFALPYPTAYEGKTLVLGVKAEDWTKADEGLEGIIYHTAHTKDGYLVFLHTAVGDIAVCANEEWEGKVYVRPEAVQLYDLANELRIG